MENPLPSMTWLEQAYRYKVQLIGPLARRQTIKSVMEPLGFEYGMAWTKQLPNADWLETITLNDDDQKLIGLLPPLGDGGLFVLVYNRSKLDAWRKPWKQQLQPGQQSYKERLPPPQ